MKKLVYLLFVSLFFSCSNDEETTNPKIAPISESVYAVGTIKAVNQYQARAVANGIIDSILVKEGDTVQIGSPLLIVSNLTQKLTRENAELNARFSNLKSNQVQLDEALQLINLQKTKLETDSLMYARQLNLWKQNIGSKVELEQRELAFKNSKNNLFSAKVRYDNLKRQLTLAAQQSQNNLKIVQKQESDFILKSEVNGLVYKIYQEKGELINSQTPLVLLGEDNRFILEMQVDEYDIFKIHKGQKVLVTMDSYKGKLFEAEIISISHVMNASSKSFTVEAFFTKGPKKLYPFITFEANIILQQKENALLIPRNYLYNDSMVILENGDTAIVKTGLKDYRMVEILSGITEKDKIKKPE